MEAYRWKGGMGLIEGRWGSLADVKEGGNRRGGMGWKGA